MDGWLWYPRTSGEFAARQPKFMHALRYAISYHC